MMFLPLAKSLLLPKTRILQAPTFNSAAALQPLIIRRFTAAAAAVAASDSSAAPSLVEDKIWLMLPSHEAPNNKNLITGQSKAAPDGDHDNQVILKWKDSCFYDIGSKSFVTTSISNQHDQKIGGGTFHRDENRSDQESSSSSSPKIVGSSHGYLAVLEPSDCSLSLVKINPTGVMESHQLPGMERVPPFFDKVFRKSEIFNHKYGNYEVVAFLSKTRDRRLDIYAADLVFDCFPEKVFMPFCGGDIDDGGGHNYSPTIVMRTGRPFMLAFHKLGGKSNYWYDSDGWYDDVIYSKRDHKFYATQNFGPVDAWPEFITPDYLSSCKDPPRVFQLPRERVVTVPYSTLEVRRHDILRHRSGYTRAYLVESIYGEILLVMRHFDIHVAEDGTCLNGTEDPNCDLPYKTFDFNVFRLDASRKTLQLVEDLGDQSLFLGINQSFAASAKQVPGIEPNSIYFGDHYMSGDYHAYILCLDSYAFGGHDFGVFNVGEKSFSACYPTETIKFDHPPIWIAPTTSIIRTN